MEPVAADRDRLGVAFPLRGLGKRHPRAARAGAPAPRPSHFALSGRSLGEPQPAGVITLLCAFLPARVPFQPARPAAAPGHAGRSRSAAGQACPGPAAPAPEATPPGLSALRPSPSPSPAARYFHTSQCPGPGA